MPLNPPHHDVMFYSTPELPSYLRAASPEQDSEEEDEQEVTKELYEALPPEGKDLVQQMVMNITKSLVSRSTSPTQADTLTTSNASDQGTLLSTATTLKNPSVGDLSTDSLKAKDLTYGKLQYMEPKSTKNFPHFELLADVNDTSPLPLEPTPKPQPPPLPLVLLGAALSHIGDALYVVLVWILLKFRYLTALIFKVLGITEAANEMSWYLFGDEYADLFSEYRRKDLNVILEGLHESPSMVFEEPESLGEDADLEAIFGGLLFDDVMEESEDAPVMPTLRRRNYADRTFGVKDIDEPEVNPKNQPAPHTGLFGWIRELAGVDVDLQNMPNDHEIAQEWVWMKEREEFIKNL